MVLCEQFETTLHCIMLYFAGKLLFFWLSLQIHPELVSFFYYKSLCVELLSHEFLNVLHSQFINTFGRRLLNSQVTKLLVSYCSLAGKDQDLVFLLIRNGIYREESPESFMVVQPHAALSLNQKAGNWTLVPLALSQEASSKFFISPSLVLTCPFRTAIFSA